MINERKIASAVDVWAALHREELVRDLKELIAIRSVAECGEGGYALGTGCHLAAEKLKETAVRYGFETENDDDYTLSVLLPGSEGKRELGILGHIDVVPEGVGWQQDPFHAVEKDGWLIGRGASDNKGPVLMALYVLRCMRELGCTLKSNLRLIAGCCEETDMRDVAHYLERHDAPAYTLNCDGAWAACIGEKGILTANLTQEIADGNLLLIGGGSGLTPLYLLCRQLVSEGVRPSVALGFGSAEDVFYAEKFAELGAELIIFTADGSKGRRGLVTEILSERTPSFIYACGPLPMLRAIAAASSVYGITSVNIFLPCRVSTTKLSTG